MIKIITDSTSYIPEDFAVKNDIKVIRLHTIVNDKDFVEGWPGTYQDAYNEMDRLKVIGKTSQPAIQDFIDAYNKIIRDGNEAIMLTISLTLSGTPNTARLAATQSDDESKITVIDSGTCAQGMWGIIEEMLEMIAQGKTREEIAEEVEKIKLTSNFCFIPDSFEHLKRGGRIGTVSSILGSLLHIKPIISFQNGVLKNEKKVIGTGKALIELVKMIPLTAKRIFVLRISESPFFVKLKEMVQAKFPNKEIFDGDVGPVVGTHVGPAIGVNWVM